MSEQAIFDYLKDNLQIDATNESTFDGYEYINVVISLKNPSTGKYEVIATS